MTTSNKTTELENLYNYLKENHLGREHAIKARDLAVVTGKSVRKLRAYCEAINRDSRFERLISTSNAIYLCESKTECGWAVRATYKQAITMLNKARAMERKLGLNGQVMFDKGAISGKEYVLVYENAG